MSAVNEGCAAELPLTLAGASHPVLFHFKVCVTLDAAPFVDFSFFSLFSQEVVKAMGKRVCAVARVS